MTANMQETLVRRKQEHIVLPATAVLLMSFGLSFLLICMAYVADLETLRSAPETIWQFVCGVPTDNPVLLPLMLLGSMLALLVGAALMTTHLMRHKEL